MNSLTLEPTLASTTPVTPAAATPAATPKRRKPRVWTVFGALVLCVVVGLVAFHAAQIAVAFGLGLTMGVQGADMTTFEARYLALLSHPLMGVVMTIIPFQFAMLSVVLLAAWRSREPLRQRIGFLSQTGRSYGVFKLSTLACFTLGCGFAISIVTMLLIGPPTSADPISTAITDGTWWSISLLSVLISVVPGLVEELFFRGYMQRRFLQRWSPFTAITATTAIFAMMHCDSLQHILAVIPLSVVAGLLAYRTNSVKPGMIVHGVHNAAVVGFGTVVTVLPQFVSEEVLGLGLLALIPTLCLIGLPMVISLLRRTKPQPEAPAYVVPEPVVESLSVLKRELALPDSVTDSRLASQAV
jgi:membrane protease YdiL (CAAX protease family)